LFACHDRATQAESSASRLQQELRVSRLDWLAFVVPKAGMGRAVLRVVPVVAAATLQHLSATTDLLAPALCSAVLSPSQTGRQQ